MVFQLRTNQPMQLAGVGALDRPVCRSCRPVRRLRWCELLADAALTVPLTAQRTTVGDAGLADFDYVPAMPRRAVVRYFVRDEPQGQEELTRWLAYLKTR